MATPKISNTINQFRSDVLSRGGPQISGLYEVIMSHGVSTPIQCYPLSVVLPGRLFVLYDHDLWGPSRKVPYKRAYTQCNMTFVIYQDWAEKTFIESWMNSIVRHDNRTIEQQIAIDAKPNTVSPDAPQLSASEVNQISDSLSTGGPQGTDANFGVSKFNDYVDYYGGIGQIRINALNSQTRLPNKSLILKEAYPVSISPLSLASDGSGYPTFSVAFQFNDYDYI